MDYEDYYRYLFLISGIWNMVASITFIFFYPWIFLFSGATMPSSPIWIRSFLILVLLFGVGYIMVSKNLRENRAVVILGAISKITVFFIFLYYTILGEPILLLMFGIIDAIFACLFIEFLVNY
ncbi:MAG: hypothetical protein ACTSVY_03575 [Candidatus Helarchaeota archaeon]